MMNMNLGILKFLTSWVMTKLLSELYTMRLI